MRHRLSRRRVLQPYSSAEASCPAWDELRRLDFYDWPRCKHLKPISSFIWLLLFRDQTGGEPLKAIRGGMPFSNMSSMSRPLGLARMAFEQSFEIFSTSASTALQPLPMTPLDDIGRPHKTVLLERRGFVVFVLQP